MTRRAFVTAIVLGLLVSLPACKRKGEERCATCGMKIDRTSPWRAEIVGADGAGAIVAYDTPRCALRAWLAPGGSAKKRLRVQEYYDRAFRDATEVRFVVGGDVAGPMGPDFVPVDPSRVTTFIQDHGADRAYALAEITLEIVTSKLGQ